MGGMRVRSVLGERRSSFRVLALLLACLVALPPRAHAYSVLTHEVIIDLVWDTEIRPLLLQRFPNATPEEIKEAHAYAYGGAVIQDLGYYPFGSQYFSNLAHYVRSGDFVLAMLREAQDINEYAFALGALSHYAADITGHPAVNRSVAMEYPKLARKFGPSVTYDEDKAAHIRVEFGFDVLQVATGRFSFDQYHDFIGFKVSKPLLQRTTLDVYGVPLKDAIAHEDLAIGTYRWAISRAIPKMTKVALAWRGQQMAREIPSFDRRKFLYRLSRADYEKAWGSQYKRPGVGSKILAILLKIVPHVGPFKGLTYKDPSPQTEQMYLRSVNQTVDQYREYLHEWRAGTLRLDDRDFDTGRETVRGEYPLTDETYADLVQQLARHHFDALTPSLKTNVLQFYSEPGTRDPVTRKRDDWAKTLRALDELKLAPVQQVEASAPAGTATPRP